MSPSLAHTPIPMEKLKKSELEAFQAASFS